MFTGIIQAIGEIAALEHRGEDLRLRVRTGKLPLNDVRIGDSIATSGVCLTVVELPGDGFWADVSAETLSKTTLANASRASKVNLEKALTPTTRLGGHLVSGHVDGIGEVVLREAAGRSVHFRLRAPEALARYIAQKGSICVDGISLTVNAVEGQLFDLNIVPHTLAETTMADFTVGQQVNLEVDIIARYLERMLSVGGEKEVDSGRISKEFLAQNGFIK